MLADRRSSNRGRAMMLSNCRCGCRRAAKAQLIWLLCCGWASLLAAEGWNSRPLITEATEDGSSSSAGDDPEILSPSEFAHRSLAPTSGRFVKSIRTRCDDGTLEVRVEVPNPFGGTVYARGFTGKPICQAKEKLTDVAVVAADSNKTHRRQRRRRDNDRDIGGDLHRLLAGQKSGRTLPPAESEKRARNDEDETKIVVLTSPVDECGIKTTRTGAEDEYEVYLYVQFDPHVQQVIDEQLLIKCSPTFGSGPMRETIVVSRSFGSGSNDVSKTALVGTGTAGPKQKAPSIPADNSRKHGGERQPKPRNRDDEPRIRGTVIDDVVIVEDPAPDTDEMRSSSSSRNKEPHNRNRQTSSPAEKSDTDDVDRHSQRTPPSRVGHVKDEAEATKHDNPVTPASGKKIVVLEDFLRNSSSTARYHNHQAQQDRRKLPEPEAHADDAPASAKSPTDHAVESRRPPRPRVPTVKPHHHSGLAGQNLKREPIFGWMDIADSNSIHVKDLLGEPDSLKVGQEATIMIKVRHRAGLEARIVDCIAHDGSNNILLDPAFIRPHRRQNPTSHHVDSTVNRQVLVDRDGCPADASIMSEPFQEFRRKKARSSPGNGGYGSPSPGLLSSGKTRRAPHVTQAEASKTAGNQKSNFEETRLYSNFKAFKFADNDEVHFKCTVILCQNYCPLKSCRKARNMSIGKVAHLHSAEHIPDPSENERESRSGEDGSQGEPTMNKPQSESRESGPKAARLTDDADSIVANVVPELIGAKEEKNSGQILATATVFDTVTVRTPNLAEALREASTNLRTTPSIPRGDTSVPSSSSRNRAGFRRRDDPPSSDAGGSSSSSGATVTSSLDGINDVESMSLEEQHLFCLTPSKMMLAFGVLLAMLLVTVLAAATFCIRSRRSYVELATASAARFAGGALTPAPHVRAASAMSRPASAIPTPPYAHVIKPGSPYFRVMR